MSQDSCVLAPVRSVVTSSPRLQAAIRRSLWLAVAASGAALTLAHAAHAQDADAATTGATPGNPARLEEISVTGSRIQRDGYEAPTPVTVTPTEDLLKATPTSLSEALVKMPQLVNSSGGGRNAGNFSNAADHGNVLNLRGVGGNRVLNMIDGVRVPPTTYVGTVDANVIPQMLVDRVEIVTAGASAAYGSDAVTGVINYILDKDFEGLKVEAQYGITEAGGGDNYRAGLAYGAAFADGRGHYELSLEKADSDGLLKNQRRMQGGNQWGGVGAVPGGGSPGTAGNPYVYRNDTRLGFGTFGGLIGSGPYAGYRFLPNGQVTPVDTGEATGTPGTYVGGDYFYLKDNATLIAPVGTDQVFGRVSFDLTDDVTAYAQAGFTRTNLDYAVMTNGVFPALIFSGNAYLPADVQAAMTASGTDSFALLGSFAYLGPMQTGENTDFTLVTAGIEGRLGDGWSWDASYTHGKAKMDMVQHDIFENRFLQAAADAVVDPASGNTVCRVTLTDPGLYPGCVPINMFGEGAITPEALAYTTNDSKYWSTNTMDSVAAKLQGDLFEGWAGPISVAVGAEYRKQKLDLTSNADPADPIDYTGVRGLGGLRFWLTNVGEAEGDLDVTEGFAEVAVPLLKDVPLAQSLDFNGAIRYTDYSTSGGVNTWKLGLTWEPVDGVRFRATKSRDIRAPTLYDLYAGTQSGLTFYVDPLTGVAGNIPQQTGGNLNLEPEEGDTTSLGVVLQPAFLPGFSLSIDWFDLDLSGAIATQPGQQMLNDCHASGGTAPVCDLIERPGPYSDSSSDNFPTMVHLVSQNLSFLRTSGIDVEASYETSLPRGDLGLRLYASYVDEFVEKPSKTLPSVDYAGFVDTTRANPEWRATLAANYRLGPFEAYVQERWIDSMQRGPTVVWDVPDVDAVFYTDATFTYRPPALDDKLSVFLTINNLFDEDPPLVPEAGVPGAQYPTSLPVYDLVGRAFTFGARYNF